jgi:hypothetical protein
MRLCLFLVNSRASLSFGWELHTAIVSESRNVEVGMCRYNFVWDKVVVG